MGLKHYNFIKIVLAQDFWPVRDMLDSYRLSMNAKTVPNFFAKICLGEEGTQVFFITN